MQTSGGEVVGNGCLLFLAFISAGDVSASCMVDIQVVAMELEDWGFSGMESLLEQDDVRLGVCNGLLEGAKVTGVAFNVPLEDAEVAVLSLPSSGTWTLPSSPTC